MTSVPTRPSTVVRRFSIRDRAARASARGPSLLESIGRRVVRRALSGMKHGRVRLIDRNGLAEMESLAESVGLPSIDIRVLDPSFYAAIAFGGSLGIAEAYIDGAWETEDLAGLIEIATANISTMQSLEGPLARLCAPMSRVAYWLERNNRSGSRRNIVAHYDLGNEFFALFLDPTMTYSCAVFENGADTLERAQLEKIDRACRKLDLRPTDHLLEIGTGWGSLAIHAASHFGCRVTTTTISDEQHRFAERQVREAGLQERITVLKRDYRDLPAMGPFDKLVSIEMIEAVGRNNLGTFFEICSNCLKPQGAALIQAIVIRDQFFEAASRRRDFLKKYIFPGSCLPSVAAMIDAVRARTDLRTWHLEDIGPHYARTLRVWRESFMSRIEDVHRMGFDDRFVRMWEYYLGYCEGAFRARHVGDVQWLLVKPLCRFAAAGERTAGRT